MNPIITKLSAVGVSRWIPVNQYGTPFNVSLAVAVTGTPVYNVDYTYDDVNYTVAPLSANPPIAWPVSGLTGGVANADAAIQQPVMAFRLTFVSGTGTATLYVLQAGARQS